MNKKIKLAAFMACALSTYNGMAQVKWPAITHQTKPWARWWWEGSAVNKKDLTWNMDNYKTAGLGGMEITPIYGVKGHESEFIQYLSPQWMDMLQHTLNEAKRLDMGIDLANATGWPFGGPWVTNEDASKEMFTKTFDVKAGSKLTDPVVYVQQPLIRSDGVAPKITDLKEPIASNKNLQLMALDQVRFEKKIPLAVLMAYNDKGQSVNLTSKVDANGSLDWTAPAGSDWKLYAIFQGFHGKMVERAAPGGEGLVIDHFSKPALAHYLDRFDQAFKGHDISGIRAFFNDSYEVDDARGQSNFTPLLFDEFAKRRGYDLRNYLPALFGNGDKETANRVLCDYRETISDLLLDNFTKPWENWAKSKNAIIRNQSHGSPANILDLYAAIDIPETEGNDVLAFKFATSAAHVTGKPLASSESATWLADHFLSSLGDVKQSIDKYILGGVNHIFYHGIAYSPQNAPWPGWLFYASVHFTPANPEWSDFSTLNNYIARVQSFMQSGKPDDDVLIYYPIFDSFSEAGNLNAGLLKHYAALRPDFNGTGFAKAAEEMLAKGYTFDMISDRQIANVQPSEGKLLTGGIAYKTIMLADCKYIPLSTMARVVEMAKAGATVVIHGKLPQDVPGFGQLEQRRAAFKALLGTLNFTQGNDGVKVAAVGKGKFLMSDDLNALLTIAGLKREQMTDSGLQFNRRTFEKGDSYFVVNKGDKAVNGWVPLSVKATSVALFDPMMKKMGLAKVKQVNGQANVYLQLQPGESCLLQTSPTALTGNPYAYYQAAGDAIAINGEWKINFVKGGPSLPPSITTNKLKSWTELGGDDAKAFSGTADYTINFNKPQDNAAMLQLDLGAVYGSAEIYLNGVKLATLVGPEYKVDIPSAALKPVNTLKVSVANLMANRAIYMDKHNMPYRIFYNTNFPAHGRDSRGADGLFTAANWDPKPSGVVGPVHLVPLKLVSNP